MNMEKIKKMIIGIIIIIVLIIIDQITKYITRHTLANGNSVVVIKDFFNFTFVKNTGGAWGFLAGKLWLFIITTLIALGGMFYFFKDFDLKTNTLFSIALCLLIAGAIGNFIDRLFIGYVTDFLDFKIFGHDFPVFNVADICITLGVITLLIKLLFFSKGVTN